MKEKFIQIATDPTRIVALDSNGSVWIFHKDSNAWYRLSAARSKQEYPIKES